MATTLGAVAVGSSVYMNVNGVRTEFLVVHQGLPSSLYDSSCDGTWLLMKDVYEVRVFNSANNNSYGASELNTYLNAEFVNMLDADIYDLVKTVKIPFVNGSGGSNVASGSNGLEVRAFELSMIEVGFTGTTYQTDGAKLDYFESGDTSGGTNRAKRIAYYQGTASYWWTRSPVNSNATKSYRITPAGTKSDINTQGDSGVRPALVMPADMGVDDSGNVTQPKPAATSLANIDNTSVLLTGCIANVDGTEYAIPYALANVDGIEVVIPFGEQVSETPVGDFDVGETVWMNVNGTPYEWIVVHQGKPSSLYDDSCNGTWLMMKDIYEYRQWNTSNRNGYKDSAIHSYLNSTFANLFDADIKAQIKSVKIPYVNGTANAAVASGANGLPAQIFLLSGYEVGFTQSVNQYFPIDGSKLDYFVSGNDSTAKAKRIANMNGEAVIWWLRSQNTSGSSSARCVFTDGGYDGGGCSKSYGIRPALVLPADILVDETGLIISSE